MYVSFFNEKAQELIEKFECLHSQQCELCVFLQNNISKPAYNVLEHTNHPEYQQLIKETNHFIEYLEACNILKLQEDFDYFLVELNKLCEQKSKGKALTHLQNSDYLFNYTTHLYNEINAAASYYENYLKATQLNINEPFYVLHNLKRTLEEIICLNHDCSNYARYLMEIFTGPSESPPQI